MSNQELNPTEEHVIDAPLSETLGGVSPPDQTKEILGKLSEQPMEAPIVQPIAHSVRRDAGRTRAPQKQIAVVVSLVAAIAASLMIAMWVRQDSPMQDDGPMIAGSNDAPLSDPESLVADMAAEPPAPPELNPTESSPSPKPIRGIPLVVGNSAEDEMPSIGAGDELQVPRAPREPVEPVMLVSRQVEAQLNHYWDAIGIAPTEEAGADKIAARLTTLLGVGLSADSISDPDRLRTEIADEAIARAIANRWLQRITEGGLQHVNSEDRAGLVGELAACFQSQESLDRTVAAWISGESPNALAFYRAISSKARGDSAGMIRRLASLTMNVDLRCTRCHDSYIAGDGRTKDYWAFAAFVSSGISEQSGRLAIDTEVANKRPFFYPLPDGREQMVEPAIATSWIRGASDRPITTVRQWSQRLLGSTELARGVVNSLWMLVHGQPLRGRVVDPISAPHDKVLDQLEDQLVQDLVRSDFDVARTLSLIIASPATRRDVPAALLPENALVASEADVQKAKSAVDAFAASQPLRKPMSAKSRLDIAMRAIGGKLDSEGRPFVAQFGEGTGSKPNRRESTPPLVSDFPGKANSLPAQWLTSIEDPESQVEHLAYLAGLTEAPRSVLDAAARLRAEDPSSDDHTALHRVWWLVRP